MANFTQTNKQERVERHPPCRICPLTLGLMMFIVCPCMDCRANGYQAYRSMSKNLKRKGWPDGNQTGNRKNP